MAINVVYSPDVAALGNLAWQAGYGKRSAESGDAQMRIDAQMRSQRMSQIAQAEQQMRQQQFEQAQMERRQQQQEDMWNLNREANLADYEKQLSDARSDSDLTYNRKIAGRDYENQWNLDLSTKKADLEDKRINEQIMGLQREMGNRALQRQGAGVFVDRWGGKQNDLAGLTDPQIVDSIRQLEAQKMSIKPFIQRKPPQVFDQNGVKFLYDEVTGRYQQIRQPNDRSALDQQKRLDAMNKEQRQEFNRNLDNFLKIQDTDIEGNKTPRFSLPEARDQALEVLYIKYPELRPKETLQGALQFIDKTAGLDQKFAAPQAQPQAQSSPQPAPQPVQSAPAQAPASPVASKVYQVLNAVDPAIRSELERQRDDLLAQIKAARESGNQQALESAKAQLRELIAKISN